MAPKDKTPTKSTSKQLPEDQKATSEKTNIPAPAEQVLSYCQNLENLLN